MEATFQVLQNPSKAKKFFKKLSRISSPSAISEKDASKGQAPPDYTKTAPNVVASDLKRDEEVPELRVLEQRIEELARELNKVSQIANEMRTGSSETVGLKTSSNLDIKTRPCPPKDQISFFACSFPQLLS
jgi:hypothetical protein